MPYLKKAAYESMQFGLEEALMAERIGPSIKQVANTETSALTVGQFFSHFVCNTSRQIILFSIFYLGGTTKFFY